MSVRESGGNVRQVHVVRAKRSRAECGAPHPAGEVHARTNHRDVHPSGTQIGRSQTHGALEERGDTMRAESHRVPLQVDQTRGPVAL
jgi:hypothetical protein